MAGTQSRRIWNKMKSLQTSNQTEHLGTWTFLLNRTFFLLFALCFLLFFACPEEPDPKPRKADCPPGFLPCDEDSTLCCEVICPPGHILGGVDSTECIPVECPEYYLRWTPLLGQIFLILRCQSFIVYHAARFLPAKYTSLGVRLSRA
ncbi:MAG: hypothetical protein ABIA75_00310 [Candidatus Neomarinimicrobiota bacterium]